jgi:hypothetical protein
LIQPAAQIIEDRPQDRAALLSDRHGSSMVARSHRIGKLA